jgi:hypothetical protein
MTSIMSLFQCAAQDVTLERVRDLVNQSQLESLTLEYKERFTPNIVKSVAGMANSYGGLILVGVTDQRKIIGVPEDTATKIVSACYEKLEPPWWQPEIISVAINDGSGLYIHVIRVDASRAPRPVLIDGAAPVRLLGRVGTADRERLAQLFAESPSSNTDMRWTVQAPQVPTGADGAKTADFILRSGLSIPLDPKAVWRPLSEAAVDALAAALNESPLQSVLLNWVGTGGIGGFNPFRRAGFNRARDARLVWRAAAFSHDQCLIEAIATTSIPGSYGNFSSQLVFTLDVVVRARAFIAANMTSAEALVWRLSVAKLYELCDRLAATLVDSAVRARLAEIAGVDPVIVPQPTNLHFVCGDAVTNVLYPNGLTPIEDAGTSHGAHLLADPAHDLTVPIERELQIDSWLQQVAMDAGLRGMERLLVEYHRDASSRMPRSA